MDLAFIYVKGFEVQIQPQLLGDFSAAQRRQSAAARRTDTKKRDTTQNTPPIKN